MADEDIVGIIQVPLNAYTYQPGKGRDEDPAIVKHLSDIFKKEGCKPNLWEHHIKGEIDAATYGRLLIALGLSEDNFRSTVQTGKYPRVRLRKRIVCLDGRQRIAAARGKFGKRFWWPVKLYRDPHVSRFSHQTKYPDGEICWHLFRLALGKPDLGGDWRSELSKSKKKILNLLLRRENGAFKHKDIVAALCAVLEFPGARKGFKLGTMHKYTPLRCPEKLARYLRRMSRIYWGVAGDASVVPHMDSKTIGCLQRRNPSNRADRDYIRLMMDSGEIFRGVKSVSVRRRIKENLLSLDVIFPSFETFHQNMIYFSVGAKILRNHIIDDPDESQEKDQKDGEEGLFQSLHVCWTRPERPLMEVSEGIFQPLVSLDAELACMLLFLDGQRDCLYLSNEPILQDKRGEPAPVAAVDPWYVFRLRARARQYGFRTAKISRGLAVKPPSPRPLDWDLDWDVRAKVWLGGKLTIRNFLGLQRDAFLPHLEQADSREKVTAVFVQKDFLEAFFGPWSYVTDGSEMPSNLPPFPEEENMQIDDEDLGPPPGDSMQVNETPPPSQPHGQSSQRAPPTSQGGSPMQEPPSQINPPTLQVDTRELVLAKTFENPTSGGHSKRNSRYKPFRQRDSKSRSKSPSSRSPISRNRRERPTVGRSRSPIRPPTHATPPSRAETAVEELVRQSPIHPLQNSTQPPQPPEIQNPRPFTNPPQDKDTSRNVVRKKHRKSPRFDPLNRPDRAKAGPSKRSPIRPPDPTPVPIPPTAEPAEPPRAELAEAPAQQTTSLPQDEGTSRSLVRQKDTKSSRFDPLSRPGRAKAGPSKRSPIRPPGSTIPPSTPGAEPAEEEPSRRSQIHPPNQPQAPQVPEILEIPSTFTEERPVRQIQELVPNQAENLAQQTTGDALQDEDTNRRPPSRRSPILPPDSTSSRLTENAKRKAIIRQRREARDQARIQSLSSGSKAQARSSAGSSSQANGTSRTKNRARQPKRSLILPPGPIGPVPTTSRVETTGKEPPSQPRVPHSPEIPEDPSTFTDERRASQLQELVLDQTADTQQTNNLPQDEERNRDNRRPAGQRDRSRGRPRGRSPSSRSLDSRNRRTRPTGGRSRSPITPSGLTTRARSPPRAETATGPSRRSPIYPPQNQTPRRSERLRLLSEEPQTPRRSNRLRLLSEEPQTPRRSERLRLLSEEPAVPTSTSRPSQKPTLTKKAVQANPLKPLKKQDRDVLRAVVRPRKIKKARPKSPKPKAVPTLRTTAPRAESPMHRNEEHQNILGIFRASNGLPVTQNPSSEPPEGLPSPAPTREEGSVTGDKKGKGKAVQNAAETIINQPERPAKGMLARLIDAVDSAIMPRYKVSSNPQPSQAQSRRSPIRPPGTGFRVPSMPSSEGSLAGGQPEQSAVRPPYASSTFRVPSMSSSEGSLQGGQMRSPVRPPYASSTFRVPSMSSSEGSLQGGQMRSPIRPPVPPIFPPAGGSGQENPKEAQGPKLPQNIDAEGVREFQPFSESRVAYPLPDDLWGEDEEEL